MAHRVHVGRREIVIEVGESIACQRRPGERRGQLVKRATIGLPGGAIGVGDHGCDVEVDAQCRNRGLADGLVELRAPGVGTIVRIEALGDIALKVERIGDDLGLAVGDLV